ncbi:MAG: mechanosensitive ion channel family protein [Roseovarius sp.]|nr:mechanosensitive ion channel family protein [Roseovarius sp.]
MLAALWLALATALIGVAGQVPLISVAQAQQVLNGPDYAEWETLATEVETALETDEAETFELERLRRKLVEFRQQFVEAQSTNATTIRTVREQIEAIGPKPEDGLEPDDIAAQREELNRRLTRLEGPVRTADLARSRADGLISGIDETIRDRQTAELLRLGPMPVNPLHWPEAAKSVFGLLDGIRGELVQAWRSPLGRVILNDNLPVIFVWTMFGLVLIARGRLWSVRLMRQLSQDEPSAGRWISSFGVSLGEWFLPYAGVYALVQAISASGMIGPTGQIVLDEVLPAAFIFLLARWLSQRVFPRHEPRGPVLRLDERCRYLGRLYGALLGLVVAAFYFVQAVAQEANWSEAANNVMIFPIQVLTGLLLWRLAALLRLHHRACEEDPESETGFADRITRAVSQIIVAVAFIGPLLAAVGYVKAAQALMLPMAMSLLLLAALLILQRFITELYVMITGNRAGANESLVPVMAGFSLIIVSLPFFALIWGARPAQLEEFWIRLTEGVSLGGIKLSPMVFFTFVVVFGAGYVATRLLQGALKNTILPKTRMDAGGRNAVVSGVGYVGIFLAALIAITSAGIDLSSLAIVAGALSVGIGFGLQNIVSNFVAGIILLIERPISEGDWIEVGGQHGYVRAISVRSTRIETFDRTDVIVPNADFVSGTVTNYTRGNTVGRVIVPVGVAYGTDTRRVEAILREVAEAHPMVLMNPKPNVVFHGFGASSLDFEIRAILRDVNWVMSVKSDMNHEIARRFVEEGIEIPFPQQDIWLRNPETLTGARAMAVAEAGNDGAEPPEASTSQEPTELVESDFDGPDGDGDGR